MRRCNTKLWNLHTALSTFPGSTAIHSRIFARPPWGGHLSPPVSRPFYVHRFWWQYCGPTLLRFMSDGALCVSGSNSTMWEALCIWSEDENPGNFALTSSTSKNDPHCQEWWESHDGFRGKWRWYLCCVCLQGTLQPQTRCLRCGDALEWSEEHRCVSGSEGQNKQISPIPWCDEQFIHDNSQLLLCNLYCCPVSNGNQLKVEIWKQSNKLALSERGVCRKPTFVLH